MKHSDSIAKIATALVAAQDDLRPIAKDSTNPAFRSRFASLDVILETVRPILAAQGLAVVQGAESPIMDAEGGITAFSVETMLVHSSGEWITSQAVMPLAKVDPQGSGSAMTYGRRYSLSALLALATDDDDDGNSATTPSTPARSAAPRSATNGTPKANGNGNGGKAPADVAMPFGKTKGKKLSEHTNEQLEKTLKWCRETDAEKFKDLISALGTVLNDRALGSAKATTAVAAGERHPSLNDEEDDLPFD